MSDNQKATMSQMSGVDFINRLNDDCLAEIFKYLPIEDRLRVQAVCKRWREKNELVWRDITTIDFHSKEIPKRLKKDQVIEILLEKSGNYLRKLSFGNYPSSTFLPLIAAHCPDLKWLQMTLGGSDSVESWALLTSLEYLSLWGMPSNFSQNFFDTLACPNLMDLSLSSAAMFDRNWPNLVHLPPTLFEKLPKLSVLFVENFHLTEDASKAMFSNSNLVHLILSSCFTEENFPPSNAINLEHLQIISMDTITDSFLSQVSRNCENLRYLRIFRNYNVTDAGLIQLGKLPQLEDLHIYSTFFITDEPFSRLHTLKRLTCSCRGVRDNGIIALMKNATNLEWLNLQTSGVTERVLAEANEIVKGRSNGLNLKIIVSSNLKEQWKPVNGCPLLIVSEEIEIL